MKKVILGSVLVLLGFTSGLVLTKADTVSGDILKVESPVLSNTLVHTASSVKVATKTIRKIAPDKAQIIYITGEIGNGASGIAKSIIKASESSKEIYLLINSPGGSVIDGAGIISAIEASTVPVNTVCVQLCASMAAIIHQYGTKRLMTDRSILMFHNASAGVMGAVPQMKTRLNFLDRYTQKMDAYIAKRAGLNLDQFNTLFVNEFWIDAEDSLDLKFNDEIVSIKDEESTIPLLGDSSNIEFGFLKK